MSYRDEAIKAYEDNLRSYGMSELMIRNLMVGFTTGFDAGMLSGEDEEIKETMIEVLLNNEIVN